MADKKEKPCGTYQVSYIKVTFDKDGKILTTTVKCVRKTQNKR